MTGSSQQHQITQSSRFLPAATAVDRQHRGRKIAERTEDREAHARTGWALAHIATIPALDAKGIEYTVVDLNTNPAALEYVVDELGFSAAPIVVADDQDHWSGFHPDLIDKRADRRRHPLTARASTQCRGRVSTRQGGARG
jgi:glutaredoxin-like protein NrdH